MNFPGVSGEWIPGIGDFLYQKVDRWRVNVIKLSGEKPLFVGQFPLEEADVYILKDQLVSIVKENLEEEREKEEREEEENERYERARAKELREDEKRGPHWINKWNRFRCDLQRYWRTSFIDKTDITIAKPLVDLDSPNWGITATIHKFGFGQGDWLLIIFTEPDKVPVLTELIKELYDAPGTMVHCEEYFQVWRKLEETK
jgi:hypothetical protein